jgi:nitrogen fixation-related uncharacterized protein
MTDHDAPSQDDAIERHSRKCLVCRHPARDLIEQEFLAWGKVWYLAKDFEIPDYRTIYWHARALGLFDQRRRNVRSVLEHLLESASRATPSADAIIRAVRSYTHIDDSGQWIDPPTRVVFSVESAPAPAVVSAVANHIAAEAISAAQYDDEDATNAAESLPLDEDPEPDAPESAPEEWEPDAGEWQREADESPAADDDAGAAPQFHRPHRYNAQGVPEAPPNAFPARSDRFLSRH